MEVRSDDAEPTNAHVQHHSGIDCDVCKGSNADAVCYCVDCNKKLCPSHEQVHKSLMCS